MILLDFCHTFFHLIIKIHQDRHPHSDQNLFLYGISSFLYSSVRASYPFDRGQRIPLKRCRRPLTYLKSSPVASHTLLSVSCPVSFGSAICILLFLMRNPHIPPRGSGDLRFPAIYFGFFHFPIRASIVPSLHGRSARCSPGANPRCSHRLLVFSCHKRIALLSFSSGRVPQTLPFAVPVSDGS